MLRKEARRLEDLINVLVMLGILMVINPLVMEYDVLVGGFKHDFFFIVNGIILPIDFHIFQDG